MPNRPRGRPSARRRAILVLAAAVVGIGAVAGCGTVTPSPRRRPSAPQPPLHRAHRPGSRRRPCRRSRRRRRCRPARGSPGGAWSFPPGRPRWRASRSDPTGSSSPWTAGHADGGPTGQVAFWSSADTVSWVAATDVPAADDGIVTAIAAVGDGFVAVGTDATATQPRAWASADGKRWSASPTIGAGRGRSDHGCHDVGRGGRGRNHRGGRVRRHPGATPRGRLDVT